MINITIAPDPRMLSAGESGQDILKRYSRGLGNKSPIFSGANSESGGSRKVIPRTSGYADIFLIGESRDGTGGERAFCGRLAGPRPVVPREPFFRERVGF